MLPTAITNDASLTRLLSQTSTPSRESAVVSQLRTVKRVMVVTRCPPEDLGTHFVLHLKRRHWPVGSGCKKNFYLPIRHPRLIQASQHGKQYKTRWQGTCVVIADNQHPVMRRNQRLKSTALQRVIQRVFHKRPRICRHRWHMGCADCGMNSAWQSEVDVTIRGIRQIDACHGFSGLSLNLHQAA